MNDNLGCGKESIHGEPYVINALEIEFVSGEILPNHETEKMMFSKDVKLGIADDAR